MRVFEAESEVVTQRKASLLLIVAGGFALSACGSDELPWASNFASAEQQFQIIRAAQAEQTGSASPEAQTTFHNMQALWGRMSQAQAGMMRGMGHMHGGGMMGRSGGYADRGTMMQFTEMNQEMLSYCLGMQQLMNQSGHADMAMMYGRMAERMQSMLSRLPESEGAPAPSSESPAAPDGAAAYASNCASCHGATGNGISGVFPPLNGSSIVAGQPETIIRVVLNGLQGPVTVAGTGYNGFMPAFGGLLTNAQIAAVSTYIRSLPSNGAGAVTASEVQIVRQATAARNQPWTADELSLQ